MKEVELKPDALFEDRIVKYDKHIGFIIPEIGISDSSYFYVCRAEHNGITHFSTLMLQIARMWIQNILASITIVNEKADVNESLRHQRYK